MRRLSIQKRRSRKLYRKKALSSSEPTITAPANPTWQRFKTRYSTLADSIKRRLSRKKRTGGKRKTRH